MFWFFRAMFVLYMYSDVHELMVGQVDIFNDDLRNMKDAKNRTILILDANQSEEINSI